MRAVLVRVSRRRAAGQEHRRTGRPEALRARRLSSPPQREASTRATAARPAAHGSTPFSSASTNAAERARSTGHTRPWLASPWRVVKPRPQEQKCLTGLGVGVCAMA
jgi:hypothetical protein